MTKTAIAVLLPALLVAAGTAHATEVYSKDGGIFDLYGKVDGLRYFSSDHRQNGDQSYARLGFKGETRINDNLTGYGQWEHNIQANTDEGGGHSWTRLAFAGLKYDGLGSVDYGRNYGVLYDIESWTDMLPEFGGDSWSRPDNYMTGRANGVLTWRNSDLFGLVNGLDVALQYQGKNENPGLGEGTNNGDRNFRNANGDGIGASATWDTGEGFSAGGAYASSDRTMDQEAAGHSNPQYTGGKKAEAWTLGMKFDANDLYLAAMYAQTRNMTPFGDTDSLSGGGIADKTQNIEITAQYQFDFGLRPSISWLQSDGKGLSLKNGETDKALIKYADIGATYMFNKNMSAYVDYKINMLDSRDRFYRDNGIGTDNIVATGLVYQF